MKRIVVIGTSGSGKTTIARQLSRILDLEHTEIDTHFWLPNWKKRSENEFRKNMGDVTAQDRWVIDGNFGDIRDIIWPRATHIVWLNYSFITIFWRALRRTVTRAWTKEKLFSGNKESFKQSFFSKNSILWWVIKTYPSHRREYPILFTRPEYSHITVIKLKNQCETDRFINQLGS